MKNPMSKRHNKRTQKPSTLVAVWVPDEIVASLDQAVKVQDTDRSKLIRKALRSYLSRPA